MRHRVPLRLATCGLLAALACPHQAVAAAPSDTTDAGLASAVRAQITAGESGKAVTQLTPIIAAAETNRTLAQHEALLTLYVEALGGAVGTRARAAGARARGARGRDRAPRRAPLAAATASLNLGRRLLQQKKAEGAALPTRRGPPPLLPPDDMEIAAALVIAGRPRAERRPDGAGAARTRST
jgi:hypothetical protein